MYIYRERESERGWETDREREGGRGTESIYTYCSKLG